MIVTCGLSKAYGLPGIRMTRWIVGREHLTTDMVRQGVRTIDDDRDPSVLPPRHLHHPLHRQNLPCDVDDVIASKTSSGTVSKAQTSRGNSQRTVDRSKGSVS